MALATEWLTAAGTVVSGLATGVVGWAGLRGINAWRSEVVGRRKAELAEEVLAQFYHIRDVLAWARLPTQRHAGAPDIEDRSLGTPVERLTEESQLFSELQASRYRFVALFGDHAAQPFDEVRSIHAEVVASAGALILDRGEQTPEQAARRRGWEAAIGRCEADGDPIVERVDKAIRRIEQICRPLIDEESARRLRPFGRAPRDHP